jgi:hypothetical protein
VGAGEVARAAHRHLARLGGRRRVGVVRLVAAGAGQGRERGRQAGRGGERGGGEARRRPARQEVERDLPAPLRVGAAAGGAGVERAGGHEHAHDAARRRSLHGHRDDVGEGGVAQRAERGRGPAAERGAHERRGAERLGPGCRLVALGEALAPGVRHLHPRRAELLGGLPGLVERVGRVAPATTARKPAPRANTAAPSPRARASPSR